MRGTELQLFHKIESCGCKNQNPRMALKVLIHFMHERLPFGCQSQQSNVEIGNKIEINYLSRSGGGSHVGESGMKPGAEGKSSWC